MLPIEIHYDCDPGQDDAIALLYALGSTNIDIKSISVVGGNIDVDQCARNSLQMLDISGRTDITVYKGCEKPMKRPLITLPHVFGPTGMAGGEGLPTPSTENLKEDAVGFLNNALNLDTIVATGPLTNLAEAIEADKNFSKSIKNLILMGGCVKPDPIFGWMGNLNVQGSEKGKAEYNFAVDPEAAKIVFRSKIKNISLIGLDVTRTVLFNGNIQKRLLEVGTKSSIIASKILSSVGEEDRTTYEKLWSYKNDPIRAMHDIIAMAYLDRPDIFKTDLLKIRIDIDKIPGQTIIDNENPDHHNVTVIKDLDRDEFIDIFCKNLSKLP